MPRPEKHDPRKGFIIDAEFREDPKAAPDDPEKTKPYGGRVEDGNGNVLATFGPDEVNTGMAAEPPADESRAHARRPAKPE